MDVKGERLLENCRGIMHLMAGRRESYRDQQQSDDLWLTRLRMLLCRDQMTRGQKCQVRLRAQDKECVSIITCVYVARFCWGISAIVLRKFYQTENPSRSRRYKYCQRLSLCNSSLNEQSMNSKKAFHPFKYNWLIKNELIILEK